MLVKLNYFKPSGKWYSEGTYTTKEQFLYMIWEEIRLKMWNKELPGLSKGHDSYIVLVEVPEHPHNHLTIIGLD